MLLLSILLQLMISQPPANEVTVDFKFKEMKLGKPTLQYFYYDVTIKNESSSTKYVAIPKWFEKELPATGVVTGKQYDSFGRGKGITLFTQNTFTIFMVPAKGEVMLEAYEMETFTEKFSEKLSVEIPVVVCNYITVGEYSLEDLMQRAGNDPLEYKMENAVTMKVTVKTK